jgi:hypothetical protein
MRRAWLLFGVVGATLVGLGSPALAQSELPEGPNRDVVMRECTVCHGHELILGRRGNTLEEWVTVIEAMQGNGLSVSSADRTKIIEYLATHLGPAR